MNNTDIELVERAFRFAAIAHDGQVRGDGETPYISHPTEVARIARDVFGAPSEVIAAAVLHDVVEDCDVSNEEIASEFGPVIASIVAEVTSMPGLSKQQRRQRQLDAIPTMSVEALVIRTADKIANFEDLHLNPPDWSDEDILSYRDFLSRFLAKANNELLMRSLRASQTIQ